VKPDAQRGAKNQDIGDRCAVADDESTEGVGEHVEQQRDPMLGRRHQSGWIPKQTITAADTTMAPGE